MRTTWAYITFLSNWVNISLNSTRLKSLTKLLLLLTSNRLRAANALLGELLCEAVSTERFLIARSKLLSDQHLAAASARETFTVPWCTLVRYSSLVDHLNTL